jgi:hypothetical protein
VPFRVLSVPLVGDVLRSLAVTAAAAALVIGAGVLAARDRGRSGRPSGGLSVVEAGGSVPSAAGAARLLGVGLLLGCAGLVVGAPWLSQVTPLYVDHYHLALDPIVFALLGLGAAALWRVAAGRVAVVAVVVAVASWNLLAVPLPAVNADGGWPAGRAAGERVVHVNGDRPAAIAGSPKFKKTTAVDYPVTVLGHAPAPAADATRVTMLCDALFEEVVGLACLGPAEGHAWRSGSPRTAGRTVRGGAGPLIRSTRLRCRRRAGPGWRCAPRRGGGGARRGPRGGARRAPARRALRGGSGGLLRGGGAAGLLARRGRGGAHGAAGLPRGAAEAPARHR